MGRFRISIGWSMIVVAVLAFDFALGRAWSVSGPHPDLDVAFLYGVPMLNILGFGFVIGRRRQGRARAFWMGFTGFGCLAVAALALDVLANRSRVLSEYEELIGPFLRGYDSYLRFFRIKDWFEREPWLWPVGLPVIFSLTIPPLLLPALIGGWVFSRVSPKPVSESDRAPEGQAVE